MFEIATRRCHLLQVPHEAVVVNVAPVVVESSRPTWLKPIRLCVTVTNAPGSWGAPSIVMPSRFW